MWQTLYTYNTHTRTHKYNIINAYAESESESEKDEEKKHTINMRAIFKMSLMRHVDKIPPLKSYKYITFFVEIRLVNILCVHACACACVCEIFFFIDY